ncbi:hypothetical protein [Actinophytocola oryzae]|uniref:Excreted virulence factor EspC (Type VII ESX diderm) n=1 Tax=Actinophytocola oryzae TaxID=502181 RepID=A0A4R7VP86_9PSEU|nr:hypothetical protein [Actinophytocola oryzae]TDV51089.1 hypothetical protein CLV71_106441 [Actinophytocola oryzae]
MVSDGFEVDLDALDAAREQVGRLVEELNGPPRDVPSAETFGHDRLAEAVTEFADREKPGIATLTDETMALHRGLTEVVRAYRDEDEDGAGRFEDIAR